MNTSEPETRSEADIDPRDDIEQDGGPRQTYYAQARSWAEDRQAGLDRSRRIAWVIASVAAAIAMLEALALVALAPLKTVVPYTLLVDRNTGFVQALDPAHPAVQKPQAALTQSLLAQYIVARETFDINSLPDQYQKVALWSAQAARRDYLAVMERGNPDSPIGRYPRTTLIETHVESVTPLSGDAALVRFYTERHDPNQSVPPRSFWVAMVRFHFSGEPMSLADRLANPLGFQVVQYRRDQEAPPPEAAPVAAAAPIPAVIAPTAAIPPGTSPDEAGRGYPRPVGQFRRPGVTQAL